MRVATESLHQGTIRHIRASQARIARLQSQISSGLRIERASDDPRGAAQALQLRGALRAREQWSRNLIFARQFAEATEGSLSAMSDLVGEARVLATRADGSQSPESLAALATEVNTVLESLLQEANRAQDGVHYFSGSDTLTSPIAVERDAAGEVVGVTAASRRPEGTLQRELGQGTLVRVNTPPADVFGEDLELFEHLIALRDALRAGDPETAAGMQSAFDQDLQRIGIAQAVSGALTQRLDHLEERLGQEETGLEAMRAEVEDLDMAQAVIDYQEEQAVLEAAYTLSSHLLDLTLTRYLQ